MKSLLLLTAQTPISHHDPTGGNTSNTLTFNRRRQFIDLDDERDPIAQEEVDAFCEAHPVPTNIHRVIVRSASFAEFVACAFMRVLINTHGRGDGSGLFSGMERYTMLENRLRTSGIRAQNLRQVWDTMCTDLLMDIHPEAVDAALLDFFAMPMNVQRAAITAMTTNYRTVVTIARAWNDATKMMSENYAAAAGQMALMDDRLPVSFRADEIEQLQARFVAEVPAISTNGLRHQLVRRPAWVYLCRALDLVPEEVEIPVGAEAIFENGGSIKAGAVQPQGSYYMAQIIRDTFPTLDLLGGVTNTFDIGESRLKMASWIVCRENAGALSGLGVDLPSMDTSVFDMLDTVTHTRQASRQGDGQMIFNFETLIPGTQLVASMWLDAFTPTVTRGALEEALAEYEMGLGFAGGQSARGFGHVALEWLTPCEDGARDAYRKYLSENGDHLRAAILDGTLGCDKVVAS
jgi:hypothetical protein